MGEERVDKASHDEQENEQIDHCLYGILIAREAASFQWAPKSRVPGKGPEAQYSQEAQIDQPGWGQQRHQDEDIDDDRELAEPTEYIAGRESPSDQVEKQDCSD